MGPKFCLEMDVVFSTGVPTNIFIGIHVRNHLELEVSRIPKHEEQWTELPKKVSIIRGYTFQNQHGTLVCKMFLLFLLGCLFRLVRWPLVFSFRFVYLYLHCFLFKYGKCRVERIYVPTDRDGKPRKQRYEVGPGSIYKWCEIPPMRRVK